MISLSLDQIQVLFQSRLLLLARHPFFSTQSLNPELIPNSTPKPFAESGVINTLSTPELQTQSWAREIDSKDCEIVY
jgi:hypothetical protein